MPGVAQIETGRPFPTAFGRDVADEEELVVF
jgi:hypothetical protein